MLAELRLQVRRQLIAIGSCQQIGIPACDVGPFDRGRHIETDVQRVGSRGERLALDLLNILRCPRVHVATVPLDLLPPEVHVLF